MVKLQLDGYECEVISIKHRWNTIAWMKIMHPGH